MVKLYIPRCPYGIPPNIPASKQKKKTKMATTILVNVWDNKMYIIIYILVPLAPLRKQWLKKILVLFFLFS